jgi:hypothetical protein
MARQQRGLGRNRRRTTALRRWWRACGHGWRCDGAAVRAVGPEPGWRDAKGALPQLRGVGCAFYVLILLLSIRLSAQPAAALCACSAIIGPAAPQSAAQGVFQPRTGAAFAAGASGEQRGEASAVWRAARAQVR